MSETSEYDAAHEQTDEVWETRSVRVQAPGEPPRTVRVKVRTVADSSKTMDVVYRKPSEPEPPPKTMDVVYRKPSEPEPPPKTMDVVYRKPSEPEPPPKTMDVVYRKPSVPEP